MRGSAHVLLGERSGKSWRCFCWQKGNFTIINEFIYGQTWKIWPTPLSLSLYSTFKAATKENLWTYQRKPEYSRKLVIFIDKVIKVVELFSNQMEKLISPTKIFLLTWLRWLQYMCKFIVKLYDNIFLVYLKFIFYLYFIFVKFYITVGVTNSHCIYLVGFMLIKIENLMYTF